MTGGPLGWTKAALIGELSSTYAPKNAQAIALTSELGAGTRDCSLIVLGDSTGVTTARWPYLLGQYIAAQYPAYSVRHSLWNDTNQTYDPYTTLGTGVDGARVDGYASFDGTTGKYVSTPSDGTLNIAGDIDVRVKVDLASWTPGAVNTLAAKFNFGGARAWRFDQQGTFLVFSWTADGTNEIANSRATVATSTIATAGTPIWLRAVLDVDNGASGWSLYYYYSNNDGSTWTQLGSTVTGAGVTSIASTNYAVEIGSRGLGTAEPMTGKHYAFQLRQGINGTVLADLDFNRWETAATVINDYAGVVWTVQGATSIVKRTGAPVFRIWNASASGKNVSYHADSTRFPLVTPVGRPVKLVIINHSHNEGYLTDYTALYSGLVGQVTARYPGAGIVGMIQNPRTSPALAITEHANRLATVKHLMTTTRRDYIDVYSAFNASPLGLASLNNSDGLHPSDATGSPLWRDTVKAYLGI